MRTFSFIMLGICVITIAYILISVTRKVDRFRRTATVYTPCEFFIDEDLVWGIIIADDKDTVVINSVWGQYEVLRSQIYPA